MLKLSDRHHARKTAKLWKIFRFGEPKGIIGFHRKHRSHTCGRCGHCLSFSAIKKEEKIKGRQKAKIEIQKELLEAAK